MARMETTKQIPLPKQLLGLAQVRIEQLGISFPEYVRHLILNDTQKIVEKIPFIGENEEKQVLDSIKEIASGNLNTLSSNEEIERHFKKLRKR